MSEGQPIPASETPTRDPDVPDCRLYVPQFDRWQVKIKTSWDKTYCYAKNPGEDYYHLILGGEIFLQGGDEVFCLRCALRQGIVTQDRLHWQRESGPTIPMPF
ncbi:hypothetical protein [Planctomicrobium sp. SH664]|uniref:hypothetical protein n=1 Tax=Planctomicrobium sp. SH664 TaxID=3448125 RepID=UPI003F5B0061